MRLTDEEIMGEVAYFKMLKPCPITNKLGKYLDTIEALQQENEQLQIQAQELAKAKAEGRISPVKCPCDASEEAQELMNAKVDGRLVELPCKVGENCFVAIHTDKRVLEITVNEFSYSTWHGAWLVTSANDCQYWLDNVYCSREEAEKAIAAIGGGMNG